MELLRLQDIGKIYVSEGNVSVGIRGVSLSFERGEFVAVTGKSGSGKSTLLNVISGMDTYEEGEMFVEGEPTSHFMQPDWEEYREKYISFIFQDYNIIESFTVLQNVELALMHIEDKKERRRRAVELIKRVGLESHMKQKGSRLSGGQKQRTVIARALAKDSPIILADEPTGNLDSVTSAEIIKLLHEVSRDKLLIVVTHNFEQVEKCATRHIRIFDGAVEFDHRLKTAEAVSKTAESTQTSKESKTKKSIKNGFILGKSIFTSKPKLTSFLCIMLIIGTLGVFVLTAACGDVGALFEKNYMFEHIDGRLVVARRDGTATSEEDIKKLAEKYGAESYLRCDMLLDYDSYDNMRVPHLNDYKYFGVDFTYGKTYGDDIIGRYPEKNNEVFLNLPISFKPIFGEKSLEETTVIFSDLVLEVVGVKYYYDNNITPECLFTKDGFDVATAISFITANYPDITLKLTKKDGSVSEMHISGIIPTYELQGDKIYIPDEYMKNADEAELCIFSTFPIYNYNYNSNKQYSFNKQFGKEYFVNEPVDVKLNEHYFDSIVYISADLLAKSALEALDETYRQFSLFFENEEKAQAAAKLLNEGEYVAVTSDTTYTPDPLSAIESVLVAVVLIPLWLSGIIFLAFFVNLCTQRMLAAFKNDMAIMRSMGISVRVIKIGMYVRMLISLIPAYIVTVLSAVLIFTSPKYNEYFSYLYAWQYAIIFIGMLILTALVTKKQIKNMFGESVKKSLKGGNVQ